MKFCPKCGKSHGNPKYCSKSCANSCIAIARGKRNLEARKKPCKQCGVITTNPKFCQISCSTTYANAHGEHPNRRKIEGKCRICGTPIKSVLKYCKEHKNRTVDITLKQARYHHLHKASADALVRTRARSIARKLGWTYCVQCGYDKHVEICHVKPVSSYSEDTLLSVINDVSNLLALCSNCHWEHDHPV